MSIVEEQRGRLDEAYLYGWARRLGVEQELSYVLGEAKGAEVSDAVALALGESHPPEALPILTAWSERASRPSRQAAYLALTLMHNDAAMDFLVDCVARGRLASAEDAARALSHFRHGERLCERVLAAARRRGDEKLRAQVDALFSGL